MKDERLEIKPRESGKAILLCRFVLLEIRFPFFTDTFFARLRVKAEERNLPSSDFKKEKNMRRDSKLNYFQKLSAFVLFISILSGTVLTGKAQTNVPANEKSLAANADRSEIYADMFRRMRDAEFARLLTKNVGVTDTESIEKWMDEGNRSFFRVFDAAYRTEAARVFEEKIKKNAPVQTEIIPQPTVPKTVVPVKRKSVRAALFSILQTTSFSRTLLSTGRTVIRLFKRAMNHSTKPANRTNRRLRKPKQMTGCG
jgi:hypothetical protein